MLGEPAADRLVGRAPTLTGRVSQTYDGYGFERLRFEGEGLAATLQGQANAKTADVAARIDLRNLSALDERLSGPS